jgi:oxygen-dependent protoporphyrinogen oxidase
MKQHFKARKAARGGKPRVKRPALYSFRGGMAGLIARLHEALGDRVRLSSPAVAVTRRGSGYAVALEGGDELLADEVVLAAPAHASARLLAGIDRELADELAGIPFASLANVYLGYDETKVPPELPLEGFGYLLDPGERSPVLGTLYCSSLFPDHAPADRGLLRVMIGGARYPDAVDLPEGELMDVAVNAVREYTGLDGAYPFVKVVKVRNAVPQYEIGHADRMRRVEARLQEVPDLALRGNSYKAVALGGQLGRESGTDIAGAAPPRADVENRSETGQRAAVG